MELYDMSLGEYIRTKIHQQFNPAEESIWTIMIDIVEGLCFIHDHQVVHGNLNPRNGDIIRIVLTFSVISTWGM